MAMSLNRVQLIGNLTRDPEMRQTPSGQSVVSFGVATNFTWTDQSGQRQEKPEFHNVVAWRKLAEICSQYLKKGSKVFIEGRLQTRDWQGEDGIKRYRTEIIADNMIMLDRRESGSTMNAAPMQTSDRRASGISKNNQDSEDAPIASLEEDEEVKIDDLPF